MIYDLWNEEVSFLNVIDIYIYIYIYNKSEKDLLIFMYKERKDLLFQNEKLNSFKKETKIYQSTNRIRNIFRNVIEIKIMKSNDREKRTKSL